MPDPSPGTVVVARIGRPQGIRGEVSVEVRTDVPQRRFVPGASFATDPADVGPLVLEVARTQGTTTVLRFAGVADRNAAEDLRGTLLLVDDGLIGSFQALDSWRAALEYPGASHHCCDERENPN